jgi:hypothetical protein
MQQTAVVLLALTMAVHTKLLLEVLGRAVGALSVRELHMLSSSNC